MLILYTHVMSTVSRTIRVSGRVQGVFFRASTKNKADELNIKGFVRNEPDGSVYIEAEGEATNMMQFEAWCKEGPRSARVERCDTVEVPTRGFSEFVVKR
jgi:acylphosphatase